MKSVFSQLVFCLVFLVGCAPVDKANTDETAPPQPPPSLLLQNNYSWEDQVINGMTYRIYFRWRDSHHTGYTIAVVNVTKDQLEVEHLQLQNKALQR
jgi:PBP1b-binding outer membrane lipoprotein LpoB